MKSANSLDNSKILDKYHKYETKRLKCKIPRQIKSRTKPQLANEIFRDLKDKATLPFKYIVADTIYGNSPEFIEAIESCIEKIYFVSIPSDTLCWLQRPITKIKEYKYRGKILSKRVTEKEPICVKTLAKSINDYFWYRRKVSEGTK